MREKLRPSCNILGAKGVFWMMVGFIAAISVAVIEILLGNFIQLFLKLTGLLPDTFMIDGPFSRFHLTSNGIVVLLFILGVVRATFQFFIYEAAIRCQAITIERLKISVLRRILLEKPRIFIPSAKIHTLLSEIFPKTAFFFHYFSMFFSSAILAVFFIFYMYTLAPAHTTIGVLLLGVVGIFIMLLNRRVRQISTSISGSQQSLVEGVIRVVRNWILVNVLKTNEREFYSLAQHAYNYSDRTVSSSVIANFAAILPLFLGFVVVDILLYFNFNYSPLVGATFVVFLYVFLRFVASLAQMASVYGTMNTYYPQFLEAVDFYKRSSLPFFDGRALKSIHSTKNTEIHGTKVENPISVKLRNVSFSYENQEKNILSNISLDIEAGTHVGIMGESGIGKSTLLAIILGRVEPTCGEAKLNERKASDFVDEDSTTIGYVGADPFLFAGTLRENLEYGAVQEKSVKEIYHALERASILSVVENLPGTLDYVLDENIQNLSAGQKQRVSLARALLNNPSLLILDEVSASLDDQTESDLAESLIQLGGSCTIVTVSHRKGILKHCDIIFELTIENGRTKISKLTKGMGS